MNTKNDGGPAFPFGQMSEQTGQPVNGFFNAGMTLRDWFAGQALAGLCACETVSASNGGLADAAYSIADAMISERSKP